MKTYNTVIVGGGASGILSGIYLDDKNSIILEKNDILGKKILLTGGGRCNLTNTIIQENIILMHLIHFSMKILGNYLKIMAVIQRLKKITEYFQ